MIPKLAIFDMAGTTINDFGLVQNAAIMVMSEYAKVSITFEDANRVMGIPKIEAFKQLILQNIPDADLSLPETLVRAFNEQLKVKYAVQGAIELMPFAAALFEKARLAGCKVYLNTGFNQNLAEIIINNLNLKPQIDGFIGSDQVHNGRPAADMIHYIMQKEGIADASQILKVGDTESDLLEGYNAGCGWNVAVLTGAYNREQLELLPHTAIYENLAPLLEIFEVSNSQLAQNTLD